MSSFLERIFGKPDIGQKHSLAVERDLVLMRFFDLETHSTITRMRAGAKRSTRRMIAKLEAEGILGPDPSIPGAIKPTDEGVKAARRAAIRVRALENMQLREEARLNQGKRHSEEIDPDQPIPG